MLYHIVTTQSHSPNRLRHQNYNTALLWVPSRTGVVSPPEVWEASLTACGCHSALHQCCNAFCTLEEHSTKLQTSILHIILINGDTLAKNAQIGHRRAEAGGWWSACSDPCLTTLWTRVAHC